MLLLTLIFAFSHSSFVSTKNVYDGMMGYDGLFMACAKEFKNSIPCNKMNMLTGVWNYHLPPSWILTLDNNCLGYTTNSTDMFGNCIVTSFGYVTLCSCEMNISICCTY